MVFTITLCVSQDKNISVACISHILNHHTCAQSSMFKYKYKYFAMYKFFMVRDACMHACTGSDTFKSVILIFILNSKTSIIKLNSLKNKELIKYIYIKILYCSFLFKRCILWFIILHWMTSEATWVSTRLHEYIHISNTGQLMKYKYASQLVHLR